MEIRGENTLPQSWWQMLRALQVPDLVLAAGGASLILACFFILGAPAYHRLQRQARAAAVCGNAATLQLAAETYAAGHQGRYPEDPLDLVPYLPGDQAPRNPYTGASASFAGGAGDLTYRSPTRGGDYVIQAWGRTPDGEATLVITLKGRSPAAIR